MCLVCQALHNTLRIHENVHRYKVVRKIGTESLSHLNVRMAGFSPSEDFTLRRSSPHSPAQSPLLRHTWSQCINVFIILVNNGLFTQQVTHILRHIQSQYPQILCYEKNQGMVLLVFTVTLSLPHDLIEFWDNCLFRINVQGKLTKM